MEKVYRTVACLGPRGSYSELAAQKLCPSCEVVFCSDFEGVAEALSSGRADCAVLPIENSIQGDVLKNLDIIGENDFFQVRELVLGIDHRLATLSGVPYDKIERVYSHEQAIEQCTSFLREHLPKAKRIFSHSTAESLSLVDERTAGIVGAHVKKEGIVLSDFNIADEVHNYTRFMLLERFRELPEKSSIVFFCAVTEHRPGTLVSLLQIFAEAQLNLTRVTSRPIRDAFGEYRFFIEFQGDLSDEPVRSALEKARAMCRQFRLLGAY